MSLTSEKRDAVKAALDEIEKANFGRLTPDAVVEAAKRKDSPLHEFFEWDVKKAANEYWTQQARDLITSVRVVIVTETRRISSVAYVRDPAAASDEQGYVSVSKLRADPDLARTAIVAEFARVASLLERARALAIVLEAEDRVQGLIDEVTGVRRAFIEETRTNAQATQ